MSVESQPFFFNVSRQQAEVLLRAVRREIAQLGKLKAFAQGMKRNFLIRPSSQPACLTLSFKEDTGDIAHALIQLLQTGSTTTFVLRQSGERFSSIDDMLVRASLTVLRRETSLRSNAGSLCRC
jgi:hypothetical protein